MTRPEPPADQSLASIESRMRDAGEWLQLEDGVIENLIAPRRVRELDIHVRRADGRRIRRTARGLGDKSG